MHKMKCTYVGIEDPYKMVPEKCAQSKWKWFECGFG